MHPWLIKINIYLKKKLFALIFLTYCNDTAFWTWLHCLNIFQGCISLDTVCHTFSNWPNMILLSSRWDIRGVMRVRVMEGCPLALIKLWCKLSPRITSESWVSLTKAGSALNLLDWSCTLLGYSPLCIHAGRLIYSNCSSEFRFQGKSSSPW